MGMTRALRGLAAAVGVAVSLTVGGAVHGQSEVKGEGLLDGAGGAGVEGAGGSLVATLRARGAKVEPLGRRGSLEGWLVVPAGERPYTLYVDDTGHAVMGLLFSREGKALSSDQVRAVQEKAGRPQGPEPVVRARDRSKVRQREDAGGRRAGSDVPPASAGDKAAASERKNEGVAAVPGRVLRGVFEAAQAVEGFDLGDTGPEVVIFADPTCLPSRAAVAELARRALKGGIRLRVLPVGARGAEAEWKAGRVLASDDRPRTWFTLGQDIEWRGLGVEAAAGVALNRRLFERTGAEFVPFALLREANGRVRSAVGLDFRRWFGSGAAR